MAEVIALPSYALGPPQTRSPRAGGAGPVIAPRIFCRARPQHIALLEQHIEQELTPYCIG